jgi:hypothetical protein
MIDRQIVDFDDDGEFSDEALDRAGGRVVLTLGCASHLCGG